MNQRSSRPTRLHTGPPLAPSPAVFQAIANVSSMGDRFELGVGRVEVGWHPFTDLLTDADVLEQRIGDVAERLGTAEARVAASILFQKLASRLCSPLFGAAVAHGLLVELDPGRVHWQPAPDGVLPLRTTDLAGWEIRDPERTAEWLYHTVMPGLLEPLAEAVQGVVKIAPGLLWGNVASSLAGTARALARIRPDLAGATLGLVRELLDLGHLRDKGELAEPAPGHPFFVRRSCCLYYRAQDGRKCGDCALDDPGARRDRWARAVRESQGAR
ncbi:(2Fe-2S)-binding protein [Microbispora sp. NPDC046933]|uniref:(2Fe-2S)-binding protein n=1 Tax=Microbispora sp. NPDC046933 TaxID=3155618 RepID=UPI0033E5AAAF